ncbi:MAG TPA: DNA polymerase I [Geminicoccus sp.]|jgi:DNA polymerase-1|uniref:DNA polymerase I n=1 Tax=Geminicoccus sp. TaxID=2024832 RepID=UPI002E312292|nr:DNA polymerase I [Geminicoccus sp.]HEX2525027.1 DNA polymerase I [Geminicoccus sp.]
MSKASRLVLVDGSGYIFRAFFALPPMTRPDGTPVNAVFGFASMLFKLMTDRPEDDLLVVFDHSRSSFRNEMYEAYKANRDEPPPELRPQFSLVRDAARAFGLPVVELEGYEADDLIATYAKKAREEGRVVEIVSSDKDLMQLVADGIFLFDPMKNKNIGHDEVVEKFGVGPERVRDVLALAGDTSDNVPGVPGIGVKTAAQLVTEYGSLDGLLQSLDKIKQPKRRETLTENADKARLSYQLVGLHDDAPLPVGLDEVGRTTIDPATLLPFLQENGFKTLISRIGLLAEAAAVHKAEVVRREVRYRAITDMADVEALLARARSIGLLAIDTETTSLSITDATLVGLSMAVDEEEGVYVPLCHEDAFGQRCNGQLDTDEVLERLRPVLADPSILKIAHNLKYDLGVLAKYRTTIAPYDDTLLISYVLDGAKNGHGMDELAKRHLDHDTISYDSLTGTGKGRIGFAKVAMDKATDYAAEDALITFRLWKALKKRLVEEKLVRVYEEFDRPLPAVVAEMEVHGIAVDRDLLRRLSGEFAQRMAALEAEAAQLVGHPFNIGSPKQLGEVLFDEMSLPGGKKGKAGAYVTDADVLEQLALQGHELPKVVLAWRQLQKLSRTYTDALIEQTSPVDHRVHTSYMLASTSTGRLSSTEPNLQNIPIRTEEGRRIRDAFVAEPGYVLMSADYSQVELRILAHMAELDVLKQAFADDIDIHRVTAAEMFGVPVDQVTGDLRRSAKTINYGIVYGIGAFGLAQRLGIPHNQARDYIDRYFQQYPGIREYMDKTKAQAREQGYVLTVNGRRCWIPEILSKLPSRRAYAERAAINAPIQGSAADIMKRAMIQVAHRLQEEQSGAKLLLQVHDELLLEVPESEIPATEKLVRDTMQNAASLSVPLIVEVGHGRSWGAAH